ncbi:hypothetical protein [Streptomyces sp. NPDC101166]|uniref:hypothetical protein n=1 Tax=Streptomyces sp. NPDC101166 TaxID=3366120 RepID=UPI00380C3534
MTTAVREAPHHRNLTCYTDYRCRLPECVERYTAWDHDREARQAAGTWDNLVDATPVRRHIERLLAQGYTVHRIAALAGMTAHSIRDFIGNGARGRRYRTNPSVAEKILAVTPGSSTPTFIDPTGAHRRLQALVAAGWPLSTLDRKLGYKAAHFRAILAKQRIHVDTGALIADVYDRFSNRKPGRGGVAPHLVRQARERAAANRWPTPAYWAERMDVIDDPDFEPLYGVTRREIVAQDANELMRFSGLDRAAAAERLGVSKDYVDHALRDHPEYSLETAA